MLKIRYIHKIDLYRYDKEEKLVNYFSNILKGIRKQIILIFLDFKFRWELQEIKKLKVLFLKNLI